MAKKTDNPPKAANIELRHAKLKFLLALFGFILVFISGLHKAEAAHFYFSPDKGSYYKNENFKVSVFVHSDISINAAEALINFPTEYLEVAAVNNIINNSIIDLWVQKPSFSNAGNTGNVRFEGIILNPGYSGPGGKLLEIVFRVKKEGVAELSFNHFSILANDGLGTNVSTSNNNARFVLLPARAALVEDSQKQAMKAVEEKIESVEQKIGVLVSSRTESPRGVLGLWNILPKWIKISVLILIGITTIILILIAFSLGIIILVWLWSFAWRRKEKFIVWVSILPKLIKKFFRRIFVFSRLAEKEFEGDARYGIKEFKKDVREAENGVAFKKILKDYWLSIIKVIRRFFRKDY